MDSPGVAPTATAEAAGFSTPEWWDSLFDDSDPVFKLGEADAGAQPLQDAGPAPHSLHPDQDVVHGGEIAPANGPPQYDQAPASNVDPLDALLNGTGPFNDVSARSVPASCLLLVSVMPTDPGCLLQDHATGPEALNHAFPQPEYCQQPQQPQQPHSGVLTHIAQPGQTSIVNGGVQSHNFKRLLCAPQIGLPPPLFVPPPPLLSQAQVQAQAAQAQQLALAQAWAQQAQYNAFTAQFYPVPAQEAGQYSQFGQFGQYVPEPEYAEGYHHQQQHVPLAQRQRQANGDDDPADPLYTVEGEADAEAEEEESTDDEEPVRPAPKKRRRSPLPRSAPSHPGEGGSALERAFPAFAQLILGSPEYICRMNLVNELLDARFGKEKSPVKTSKGNIVTKLWRPDHKNRWLVPLSKGDGGYLPLLKRHKQLNTGASPNREGFYTLSEKGLMKAVEMAGNPGIAGHEELARFLQCAGQTEEEQQEFTQRFQRYLSWSQEWDAALAAMEQQEAEA